MIITIDGPSGAGKGTVSTYLALKFNLHQLDTGLLYRALAKRVLDKGIALDDTKALAEEARQITISSTLEEGLRAEEIASIASQIAAYTEVREVLNQLQRDFAYGEHPGYAGVILDGRDIGTVICPDAPCKIYLTAAQEVRAQRRHKEEKANFSTLQTTEEVQQRMEARDRRDSSRQVAPLNAAPDAFLIDTSYLTVDEVCKRAAYYIEHYCLKNPSCSNRKAV